MFRLVQKKWESAEHRQCPETPHEACQPCGLDRFAVLNIALFPAAGTRLQERLRPWHWPRVRAPLWSPPHQWLWSRLRAKRRVWPPVRNLAGSGPGQQTAPAASPLRGRRLVSVAAYWRSVSDLLPSEEFPLIYKRFHKLFTWRYQHRKKAPPCSHPDRPIPPPARSTPDPCSCEPKTDL